MPRSRPGAVLLASCLGQFMVVLDVSVVNVALPTMRAALGFDATGLQWVVNAYTLAFAGFLLLGGRAADLFGRRATFLVGLVMFGAASVVGGLASTPALLLVARAAQGLGAAVISPASLTILTTSIDAEPARSRALAMWTAVAAAGGAVGGLAGGVLVSLLSWRWIFLVNVPVIALTIVLTLAVVHETRARARPSLDVAGAVLATAALVTLVLGVVSSETRTWASPLTWGSLVFSGVLGVAFTLVERRVRDPLVPFGILRIRSVAVGNAVMALVASTSFAMWYFVSLHMQNVLGFDALAAGLAFLPQSAGVVAGSQLAGRLLGRVGARTLLLAGTTTATVGFAWFARISPQDSWVVGVLGPGVVLALGMGVTFTPLATLATSGVDGSRAGLASGLLNTARQLGGAVGLAVLATLASAHAGTVAAAGAAAPVAATAGTARAFAAAALIVVLAGVVALACPSPRRATPTTPAAASPSS